MIYPFDASYAQEVLRKHYQYADILVNPPKVLPQRRQGSLLTTDTSRNGMAIKARLKYAGSCRETPKILKQGRHKPPESPIRLPSGGLFYLRGTHARLC